MILKILAFILIIFALALIIIKFNRPTIQNPTVSQLSQPEFKTAPLTIDRIFGSDHTTASLPAQRKRILIATGDILPAREVNVKTTLQNNFKWPYEKTADFLKTADLTFINLETPLIKNCPLVHSGFKFCGDEKNIEGLIFAGVDVASLANNHAGNYGQDAVNETANLLNNNQILSTGIDGPVHKDVQGLKFAFLGYNDIGGKQPGIAQANVDKIKTDIKDASFNADLVIVTFHWGTEYRSQPDERQKYLGHLAIDSGADLVIGNHPHWIQPVEIYKDKIITYAHGNFVFDQEWSLKTKQGVVGKYTFLDKDLVDIEFFPVLIENYGQPHFLQGTDEQKILDEMQQESLNLAKTYN